MILEIIILSLSIPLGFLVSYMARDELISGRKWFRLIFIISILLGYWFYLIGKNYISLTSFFMSFFTLVSYIKSFDAKLTKSEKF